MANPIALIEGQYYHVYNRGNNRENLFREERNYLYFLKLYAYHIGPVADTFAYCLLKNHFHFLIRIKDLSGVRATKSPPHLTGLKLKKLAPSKKFSNFFNAYARTYNHTYQRTGALFQRPFGRILVSSDAHFKQLVTYIHQNPQKHKFVADFRDWKYSSYHTLLASEKTHLHRSEVLDWFNTRAGFVAAHQAPVAESEMTALAPEDFD